MSDIVSAVISAIALIAIMAVGCLLLQLCESVAGVQKPSDVTGDVEISPWRKTQASTHSKASE